MTGATLEVLGLGLRGQRPDAGRGRGGCLQFYAERFGLDDAAPRPPPTVDEWRCRALAAAAAAPGSPVCARPSPTSACCTPTASRFRTPCAPSRATSTNAPDVVARPRSEDDVAAVLEWAADAGAAVIPFGGGSSVVGGVEPAVGDGYAGTISLDLRGLDRVLEVDRDQPRRAHPGRHPRAGARGGAEAARPHDPALSAELRVLDPRRLDRDPLGRPLRHALHPYRRLRRKPAHRHARGHHGEPPPARLRRRAEPRPPDHRLGGRARRDHRGLDAAAGPAALPRRRGVRLRRLLRGRQGRARRRPGRALSLPTCALIDADEAGVNGVNDGSCALLVLAFESADHPVEAWMARALRADPGPRRPAAARRRARPRPGAPPSSACPTRAS